MRIYDTYTRENTEFIPLNTKEVGLYCCGPTVYHYAHIGNLRTYIFEDLLRRGLEFNGYKVKHVMNITDVGHLVTDGDSGEDKMEKGARRTGKTVWEIAEEYTQAFMQDMRHLNIMQPTIWCKATEHIPEQIETIKQIEAQGYTYATSDGIYFDTSKLTDYGYLARLNIEGLQAGARVEQGEKRNLTDFSLWKFSPKNETRQMEWESPWGVGFPGWHIECSAMSAKYLGKYFDIHCGGEDHIPIHHTNEIAQTQAAFGTRLAKYWMHAYFLQVKDSKMAKSDDNFLRVQSLIEKNYDPLAYRYMCLNAHYRTRLVFSWESIDAASTALERLRTIVYECGTEVGEISVEHAKQFKDFIDDDLNTPRAIALAWDVARSNLSKQVKRATIIHFDQIFGLNLATWKPREDEIPAEVSSLLEQRKLARTEKRWKDSDIIRDQMLQLGFEVKDTPQGMVVKKVR